MVTSSATARAATSTRPTRRFSSRIKTRPAFFTCAGLKGAGKTFRDITKNAGFGILDPAVPETIFKFLRSKGFQVELTQVIAMFEEIHEVYHRYYAYCDENHRAVMRLGYMRTKLTGRIRWLGWRPTIQDVSNFDVQSCIADVMNLRLIKLATLLPEGTRLVAQIHDAAIYEVPEGLVDVAREILRKVWAEPVIMPHNGRAAILPISRQGRGPLERLLTSRLPPLSFGLTHEHRSFARPSFRLRTAPRVREQFLPRQRSPHHGGLRWGRQDDALVALRPRIRGPRGLQRVHRSRVVRARAQAPREQHPHDE